MTSTDRHQAGHEPYRVLIVCTGNTCRSPMAEGILKKFLVEAGRPDDDVLVSSAGTMGINGAPATKYAQSVSRRFGIDISAHRSRGLTRRLIEESHLILTLSSEHADAIRGLDKSGTDVQLLRAFPHPSHNPRQDSVADPIGGTEQDYERTFLQIDEALRRGLSALLERVDRHRAAQT